MIKKLMMLFVAAFAATGAWAETWTDPDTDYTWTYYYTYTDRPVLEIANYKYNGDVSVAVTPSPRGTLTIPSKINGDYVESIGYGAFEGCEDLTSVIIPDSVFFVDSWAFLGCKSLKSVVFDGINASLIADSFPKSCRFFVRHDSTGWGVAIPGVWNGHDIRYVEDFLPSHSSGESLRPGVGYGTNVSVCHVADYLAVMQQADGENKPFVAVFGHKGCVYCRNNLLIDPTIVLPTDAFLYNAYFKDRDELISDLNYQAAAKSMTDMPLGITWPLIYLRWRKADGTLIERVRWYGEEVNGERMYPKKVEDLLTYVDEMRDGVSCYVQFCHNYGEVSKSTLRIVSSNRTLGELPVPIRDGYDFEGWYTVPQGGTKISANTKVTSDVTYYAQWVYDGSTTVSAVVAEGCEAMGKVSGGKTAKAGTKLTLKATANNGYVFAGWDANVMVPMNGVDYFRNPTFSYVVNEYDENPTFVAYFMPVEEDWVDVWVEMDSEYTTGEEIDDIYIGVDSGSLTTIKVQGLPSGLKFTDKPIDGHMPNCIYGTPKKSGVYAITVTATTASKKISTSSAVIVVRKENEKMVKLAVQDWYDEETDTSVIPGKVSGGGIFAEGKKVSLKATANKGFVFAGWWDVANDDWFYGAGDYRNPTLSYVMTDSDVVLEAVFIPASEDWVEVGLEMDSEYTTGEEISDIYVEVVSGSLATLKFKGLPSGLKYTAKTIYNRDGELLHDANTIYGTPTKSGVYTVEVTATTASKKTSTSSAVIVVRKESEKMLKLAVQDWYDEETDTSVIPGKVSGGGIFAEGKKVSLKATANKGFVFAGWWDVANDDWFYGAEDYRNPTLSYVMTDSDTELKAVFAPIAEDNILDLYVEGEWITANADDNVFYADGEVDVKLEIDSLSLPKASVSGLPKGLKFDAKTNMITGMPTAPGLYTVTVKLTNQTIKKAIEKKFTISVSNLTGANDYFIDGLYNGVGEKYSISVGISNIEEFLPSLALNSGMAKLAVSGLPAGLKYDAANGKITGVATKAGTYTVTLTVTDGKAKYVSTITVEIKSLPDWVVGMFEGCFNESGWYNYSNYNKGRGSDWEAIGRFTVSVTKTGKVTGKFVKAHETQSFTAALVNVEENRYEFFADYSVKDGNGWDERGELSFAVIYDEYENTHCARIEGELLGDENNGQDMPFVREFYGWRNLWNVKGISLPKVAKTTAYNMAYADEEYDIYGELSLSFSAGRNTVVASFAFDDFEDQRTLKITKCTSQLIVTGYDETSGVFSVLLPVYMKHLDEPGDDEWIDLDFLIPMEIDIKGNVNILWDDVRYAHDDWW